MPGSKVLNEEISLGFLMSTYSAISIIAIWEPFNVGMGKKWNMVRFQYIWHMHYRNIVTHCHEITILFLYVTVNKKLLKEQNELWLVNLRVIHGFAYSEALFINIVTVIII